MYTRCPNCSSTFRVTAAVLQMADGEVRCGFCGVVFNALHTLVDDWSGAGSTPTGAPRLIHPDAPLPAKSPTPAEESAPSPSDALEFNVPENEWQRYFIASEETPPPRPDPGLGEDFGALEEQEPPPVDDASVTGAEAESPDDTRQQPALPRTLEEETADTHTWQTFLREAEPEAEHAQPLYVIGEDAARVDQIEILIRRPAGMKAGGATVAEPEPDAGPALAEGPDVSEPSWLRDEEPAVGESATAEAEDLEPGTAPETVLDWGPPPPFTERAPRPPAHPGRWLAASMVAAVLLASQGLHSARDTLAADPTYGPYVRDLYGRLGWPLYPAWPLEAYEIRDMKAIAERSAPGALDIVAEIAATGRQPVGLPLVRVVLRDRWSRSVASGIFDPAHYLAEARSAAQAYAPGTLIAVEISLKDPGPAAQGYELDVCVPNRKSGLQCKTARDPFRH